MFHCFGNGFASEFLANEIESWNMDNKLKQLIFTERLQQSMGWVIVYGIDFLANINIMCGFSKAYREGFCVCLRVDGQMRVL